MSELLELERVLMSKQEKLTPQEANILESCKSKAIGDFISSAIFGGTVAWTATLKLNKLFRINLATGAAAFFGLWRFGRSLDSSAESILQQDGSRMQKELADILVTRFQNVPSKMQLIYKYFYIENTYDDSTSDHPKLRWRYRNSYSDNDVNGHRTHNYDFSDSSLGDSHDYSNNIAQDDSKEASDNPRTKFDTKHIFIKPVLNMKEEADPLDSLFGYNAPVEETSNKPLATHNRSHKRSHRRRRMRHYEELSNSEA